MYEVGVVGQFEAAHRLRGDFGPATRLHGHTYRVEVTAKGPALREDGTLCDIGVLQNVLQEVTGSLHYRNLDDLGVFEGLNTTAEVVAQFFFEQIARHLTGQGIASLVVRLWESPQAYASYEGSLA